LNERRRLSRSGSTELAEVFALPCDIEHEHEMKDEKDLL
jgi:hypothetical protein